MTFDLKYTLNGGKRFTPILLAESQLYGVEVRDYRNAFTARYPNYTRGDFRVAFKIARQKINARVGCGYSECDQLPQYFLDTIQRKFRTDRNYVSNRIFTNCAIPDLFLDF